MIKVLRSGFLTFYKYKFKCSFGKNGLTKNKREGDRKTPMGNFKIIKCYYRSDRIKKPKTKMRCIQITKKMGWCDDFRSKKYNTLIKLPSKLHHEKLYRKDRLYDILVVINYNTKPVITGLGSAIFLHVAKKNYNSTKGCIALKREDLIILLKKIDKFTKIKIG